MITVNDIKGNGVFTNFTHYTDFNATVRLATELTKQGYLTVVLPSNDGYEVLTASKPEQFNAISAIIKNNPDVRVVGDRERAKRERAIEQMNRLY